MGIIIFGDGFTFPDGDAPTNRVHTYAKGFIENGVNVHVICFRNDYLDKFCGETDGIKYYHPFGQSKRSKYFLYRSWVKILKFFKTLILITQINKKEKINTIIVYSMLLSTHLVAWCLSKLSRSKLMKETGEHPMRLFQNCTLAKWQGLIKLRIEAGLCDGVFCISQYLVNFYQSKGLSKRKLFLVPSTVDTKRFGHNFDSPFNFKYILYCGGLTILKDGVDILIKSYTQICSKHPEIKLILIGEADNEKDEIFFRDLVSNLNIHDKVVFTGKLSRTVIPAYLCNAEILSLARPRSIVADAGFPSKLTEYLATGKPVVVTMVGEIPIYLRDKENAFLSEPNNVNAFADKLDFVLCNYHFAKKVGEKGKELTETIFNYNFQAKRILNYITYKLG